ncbi:hypothetical protein [Alcaligenes faecalis]|uniref:hypothetical protein n=1 Tax=Alcaligenes faecalis TaxID=511 RepID=UPI00196AEEA8|nr:hypothetical protein [Alcaligenes faecalis]
MIDSSGSTRRIKHLSGEQHSIMLWDRLIVSKDRLFSFYRQRHEGPAPRNLGYYAASWLAALAVLALFAFINFHVLKPTDVSGTLLGGMFGALFNLSYWVFGVSGLCALALFRLSGWHITWALAGLLQVGISVLWRIQYWQAFERHEQMFSPGLGELYVSMLVGAGLAAIGIVKYRQAGPYPIASRPSKVKTVVALLLVVLYLVLPLHFNLRTPLPDCAFGPNGQQLTLCLENE